MDANPTFSLFQLYRNDPIYSLCASDLMTASQTVNNNFIKEQKQLVKTLRKLEQQKLIRMQQLNEERRQFAFLMRKRLSPRGSSLQRAAVATSVKAERGARCALSAPARFLAGRNEREASAESQGKRTSSSNTVSSFSTSPPLVLPSHGEHKGTFNGSEVHAASKICVCECGRLNKFPTRSDSSLPLMQQRIDL